MARYDDFTIILPTLNEGRNIAMALTDLTARYPGCRIIVSDDGSTDGTREAARSFGGSVLLLDRAGEPVHGLAASVVDACERVTTKYFIVMDADGQHPSDAVGEVAQLLRRNRLVVASRARIEKGWGWTRKILSYSGSFFGKTCLLLRGKNYFGYDVLGGFFGCETELWRGAVPLEVKKKRFSMKGYKVLYDFLKCAPSRIETAGVDYTFRIRRRDASKISFTIFTEYLRSCLFP